MKITSFSWKKLHFVYMTSSLAFVSSITLYDHRAYIECQEKPEKPLYNGGLFSNNNGGYSILKSDNSSPVISLGTLNSDANYCFSTWVKIKGASSATVTAYLQRSKNNTECVGSVIGRRGCWSFLKGGFSQRESSNTSLLYFNNSGTNSVRIKTWSNSLQPFTKEGWRAHQQYVIDRERKRKVVIHVSDSGGTRVQGAIVAVSQTNKAFPFGSAIAKTILQNSAYQEWFLKRFNAAVFENELKWYATERVEGRVNYTAADEMLSFVRRHKIPTRGHNIFWEDPKYVPEWVRNLTGPELKSAVDSRIEGLLTRYKEEFIHWDVSNEMLHFDFYERRLGLNATLSFYQTTNRADPLATLFLNEFNVLETCSDPSSGVDSLIAKIKELERGAAIMHGIGLEGHFSKPNIPLMRAILDKLRILGLPIWLTEVDISNKFEQKVQAEYLEEVLREGFGHPAVKGIMLWAALHPTGCYQMCLTDNNMGSLAAGEVVDYILREWTTPDQAGLTDDHGCYNFDGFLGDFLITVQIDNRTSSIESTVTKGQETQHLIVQI